MTKVLGQGESTRSIISSALLVAILFFYIFAIGSYFQVDIAPLENRVNHHMSFLTFPLGKGIDEFTVIGGTALWLALSLSGRPRIVIFAIYIGVTILSMLQNLAAFDIVILFSFPLIVSLLIYNHFRASKILHFSVALSLNYLAIFFIALTAISLIISSAPMFSVPSGNIPVNDYAYDIFLLFGSLTPFLIFFLITGSSARLLIGDSLNKILKIEKNTPVFDSGKLSKNAILCLFLIMSLSIALSIIPHYPAINGNNQEVGADSGDYVIMQRHLMDTKNPSEFVHQAFVVEHAGDRPFFLIFWYAIAKTVPGSTSYISDHLTVLLSPALVLSTFLLAREITSNYKMSLLAAFITAVSFQTLIGIYAGFYANMFALVIGYLSLVFLLRFLKKSSRLNFAVYLLLMMAFVFSHEYTWTILTLVTSIFLIIMYKFNYYDRRRIILLSLVILLSVTIDVLRTIITNAQGGISYDVALAGNEAGPYQLMLSWNNLTDTMQNYGGGQFGNFIVLSLCLFWLVRSNLRQPSNILLAIFLAIGVFPLVLGNELVQFRVLYDIPFQIPAAIALACIGRKTNGLLMLPICIWLLAISMRLVTNFYYVSPS